MYTDSLSVIGKIQEFRTYPFYYPGITLTADWDVLQAITTTIQMLPIPPTLQHVKGHQDRDRAIELLSLPAQLNIEADYLASQYKYPPEQPTNICPIIAGNKTTAMMCIL